MIAAGLLTPLLVGLLLPLAGLLPHRRVGVVRRVTAIAAPLTVLPAVLLAGFGAGERLGVPWLLFGATFALDAVARPMVLIAALLYGAALLSISWIKWRHTERRSGALSGFLLLSYLGNIGVYLAADAVTFYLSFAVMSFSAAGLVVHYRSRTAHRATRIYLVMSVLSETAILAALLLVVHAGGRYLVDAPAAVAGSSWAVPTLALLVFGFGVKAGTVPLHVWLPLAHPAAPPAASAVLSGAMVKAGLIGWLRFLPLGQPGAVIEVFGWVLLALAILGAFAAVALGVLQRDPKVVLAYSTISQLGFVTAVIAAGLLEPGLTDLVVAGVVIYAVHHGLAKGALFLGVPVVRHYGHGSVGWLVLAGMVGAGLAVAGAPLTSGAFGKYVSKEAASHISVLGLGLDAVLPLVATGSTVLLMRFARLIWTAEREPRRPDGELWSWLLVVIAGIAVPWWVGARWTPAPVPQWDAATVWNAIWPIGLGLALGGLAWGLSAIRGLPRWARPGEAEVQPGDLVVAEEAAAAGLASGGATALDRLDAGTGTLADGWGRFWQRAGTTGRGLVADAEKHLEDWPHTGVVFLVLLAGALIAMALTGSAL